MFFRWIVYKLQKPISRKVLFSIFVFLTIIVRELDSCLVQAFVAINTQE